MRSETHVNLTNRKFTNTMKTTPFLASALALFATVGAFAQSVDEIVDKHIAALGGADKLKGVKTLVMEQSISVQGMDIPSKTTLVLGKASRSESTVMGNSMIQVVDGSSGWMVRPAMMGGTGDPEDMPADQLKQQMGQLDVFPLLGYKEKGTQLELVGKEKVDGKDVYHLKVTGKDGQPYDEYIDATTYMVSKIKRSMNGQMGEIMLSDYKETDGIKFPKTMEMEAGQMGTLTFTTEKVTVNGNVDEAIFKKPAK